MQRLGARPDRLALQAINANRPAGVPYPLAPLWEPLQDDDR